MQQIVLVGIRRRPTYIALNRLKEPRGTPTRCSIAVDEEERLDLLRIAQRVETLVVGGQEHVGQRVCLGANEYIGILVENINLRQNLLEHEGECVKLNQCALVQEKSNQPWKLSRKCTREERCAVLFFPHNRDESFATAQDLSLSLHLSSVLSS